WTLCPKVSCVETAQNRVASATISVRPRAAALPCPHARWPRTHNARKDVSGASHLSFCCLLRLLLAPRPCAGLGLERIAAFGVLVIRAPVNILVQLVQQGDVLRAVDIGLFDRDENPAFRVAPAWRLDRRDHLWCHVRPRQERLILYHAGLPVDVETDR